MMYLQEKEAKRQTLLEIVECPDATGKKVNRKFIFSMPILVASGTTGRQYSLQSPRVVRDMNEAVFPQVF